MAPQLLSPKQLKFCIEAKAKWNIAHGSVRSGKTVGTLFAFLHACLECPDSDIYMVGHTSDTIYRNAVKLVFDNPIYSVFRPFCTWSVGRRELLIKDKKIKILGAKDEGCIGNFQGNTWSIGYCDEMTLYPESIIDMIDTRLSKPHSIGFAAMNPSHPNHKIKQWIDKSEIGDKNYYSQHYTLDDNPYVDEEYKKRIRDSLSGLFYKRNFLGLWCLAEGSIFDFFDVKIHVSPRPRRSAEYWIAGIDYGSVNPFACVLLGVNTGHYTQEGPTMWVEKEYYWDPRKTDRQKTNSEFADDIQQFLEPYAVKNLYIDPSAASFKVELRKRGIHVVDANNDVEDGIRIMTSIMKKGDLYVCAECKNTIREIQSYVWDSKAADKGHDEPVKKCDHAIDALRYCVATHKISAPTYYQHNPIEWQKNKYGVTR